MTLRKGLSFGLAALLFGGGEAAAESQRTILIMDGSGSMWGQIDGRPKLEIAREILGETLLALPETREIGLMSYGHRRRGDCGDIELVVPPGPGTAQDILGAVNTMRFLGKTPITEAVRQAAEALREGEEAATVVLVTDGIESCAADPCALARELAERGVGFTAHVVGFGLSREEGAQVACLAEATGGRYVEAGDAEGLAEAFSTVLGAPAEAEAEPEFADGEGTAFEFDARTLYPGGEWMAQVGLDPTGMTSGDFRGEPAAFDFPPDGAPEACAAQCAGDSACAAWRYEPPGSYFVEHARCSVFEYRAEFDYSVYAPEEGWVSGLKPDAVRLIRPWPEEESFGEGEEPPPETGETLEIRLAPPEGYEDLHWIWSAEPLEEQAYEVMAMPYPTLGDFTTALEPGLWRVHAEGAGFDLAGEIRVGAGETRFVIPLSPTPHDLSEPSYVCVDPDPCEFYDALTGLRLTLPPGWSLGRIHYYETAAGIRASQPTAEIFAPEQEEASPAIALNLRQAGTGRACRETALGELCLLAPEAPGAAEAYELIAGTLAHEPFVEPGFED